MAPPIQAPVIAVARHRIQTDGQGVTTLVCFHGCPLRCHWCLNPFSFNPDTKYTPMTPEMLYQQVKKDELYFLATNGGVTFGGGEPLLYADFLKEFRQNCGKSWHLCAETSLAVPWEQVEKAAQCIDTFYIDIKDINPAIYNRYTGKDNELVLSNLKKLTAMLSPENIIVRVPLIPGFNTKKDRQNSHHLLKSLGITQFDFFTYKTT